MKRFLQGSFSRYCSIYSTLNGLQQLGLKLKQTQWQELYDYLAIKLYNDDELFSMICEGLAYKQLEDLFTYTNKFLQKHHKKSLSFQRPFWNASLTIDDLVAYIKEKQAQGLVTHIRIKCSSWDHYTIIKRISKDKIHFFDSCCGTENIKLKSTSTKANKYYKICLRQVYFLELKDVCKRTIPQTNKSKPVQTKSKSGLLNNCAIKSMTSNKQRIKQ